MPEPLKEVLFSRAFFADLARDFQKHLPAFPETDFLDQIYDKNWESLELKGRMRHVTLVIHQLLGLPFREAVALFKKVISEGDGMSFGRMFFPDYVEVFGLDDPETSLEALAFFTPYASAEFAVRPFILRYGQPVLDRMRQWASHPDEHLRRLASEGCRPRLPWAMALPFLKKDPAPILPILETLKADPSEYVRRSVANNLNDISKDHPELVLGIAARWLGHHPDTDRLVKHGLRTLLKAGRTEALLLFGFEDPSHIEVKTLTLSHEKVKIGEKVRFHFELVNPTAHPTLLRIEYTVDFVKKSGRHSAKVFHLTEKTFPPGSSQITSTQSFADLSTREHHPGLHHLSIIVNGVARARASFELVK